jgi:hypothetical protein
MQNPATGPGWAQAHNSALMIKGGLLAALASSVLGAKD